MRILVTGGCGKLGAWVARELAASNSDHEVTVLDAQIRNPMDGVRYVAADIISLHEVVSAARDMDVVVHLAAVPRPDMASELQTFTTNAVGTFIVHEAAYLCGVGRVVSSSSVAVLGWTYRNRDFDLDYVPVDEDHPVHPQGAYALSKLVGEGIARSYTERSGMVTIVLRPNWIAEPEQLVRVAEQGGRAATAYDTFTYIDVRDLADAFRLAVETPLKGHHLLYTNADDSIISEPLVDAFRRVAPSVAQLDGIEDLATLISNERAKQTLGWVPQHSWRRMNRTGRTHGIIP
ncbi:MAG: NAD-dependent epimerase/dehydratase family protein [Actinobacteria bacterium]|nr:NAD-dependent epimerase/dehydratase family protein [Actinomycetota bacterium]